MKYERREKKKESKKNMIPKHGRSLITNKCDGCQHCQCGYEKIKVIRVPQLSCKVKVTHCSIYSPNTIFSYEGDVTKCQKN